MPKRTFLILLLLAVFSFGFAVGSHPCEAGQGQERESRSSSCHETPGSPDRGSAPSQEDGEGCCDTVCPHACHMPAAASGVRPPAFVVELVSQVAVQVSDPALSPLADPIDHVPLA